MHCRWHMPPQTLLSIRLGCACRRARPWGAACAFLGADASLNPAELQAGLCLQARRALECSLCRQRHGACIQCACPTCFSAFHPLCARSAQLAMMPLERPDGPDAPASSSADSDASSRDEGPDASSREGGLDASSHAECQAAPRGGLPDAGEGQEQAGEIMPQQAAQAEPPGASEAQAAPGSTGMAQQGAEAAGGASRSRADADGEGGGSASCQRAAARDSPAASCR